MKLVKIFGGLLIMILVLFFLMQNTSLVDVNLIFKEFSDVPVAVVMLGSLAVGIIIGYGSAILLHTHISGKAKIFSAIIYFISRGFS